MKISINWIKNYVKPGISTEKLIHKLTMAGLEVEDVISVNNDIVLELEVTPNRPDCLSMIGMAREISAILNKPFTTPKVSSFSRVKQTCDITVKEPNMCPYYTGILVEGVDVKPASDEIKNSLSGIGMRPVNNIVDITNFSLMENGQPLHAFDYDKLEGGRIIVREAKKGETITTLDGVKRELDETILVIADAKKPVAIAGIMGGQETEVGSLTKNILLESAQFDPITIRRTARKLGLSSDSSYRFERGVTAQGVEYGALRAVDLIKKYAGGKITATKMIKAKKVEAKPKTVIIEADEINNYLGTSVSESVMKTGLKKLGFNVNGADKKIKVSTPYFRQDVNDKVDVIEEVARIIGFDNIEGTFPTTPLINIQEDVKIKPRKAIVNGLIGQGLNEILTFALISEDALKKSKQMHSSSVRVFNPLTKEQEMMRPTLLPSMLGVCATNINRGQKALRLFESGKTYFLDGEKETVGIIITGANNRDWRKQKQTVNDFYTIKGMAQSVVAEFDARFDFKQRAFDCFENGQSAVILLNKKTVGMCGKVDEDILKDFGIKEGDIYFCEAVIDDLLGMGLKKKVFASIAEFPAVTRDISVAVKQDVTFAAISDAVLKVGGGNLKDIELIEEYMGDKIGNDQRGLVFSLTYQSRTQTLKEEEVSAAHDKVLNHLLSEFDIVLR